MAGPGDKHLAILKQGVNVWNRWREEFPETRPILMAVDLSGTNLSGVNLSGANINVAYFNEANLSGANLNETNSSGIDLKNASLGIAQIWDANFEGADLRGADLNGAKLVGSKFRVANLRGADLSGAELSRVNFSMADLSETTIKETLIGNTILTNVDLSSFVNAHVIHHAQSFIDHSSIAKSIHCENLLPFLVAAGMPHIVATYTIEAIRSLDPNGLFNLMHSTFISYGGPDEPFATKLQEALQSNGVTTFLFKKDAVPGQAISDVMRDQVREKDRIVVICSENSLDRPGVLNEMELTLRREAKEGGHILLIPIAIDRYVHDGWNPENDNLKEAILERVIADFVGADTDQAKFDQGIERLLQALKASR